MVEFYLSNQGGIEMLKMCNKEWGVLGRLKKYGVPTRYQWEITVAWEMDLNTTKEGLSSLCLPWRGL